MGKLNLTYSLADQDFVHTKSVGILNVSRWLFHWVEKSDALGRATLLVNSTTGDLQSDSEKTTKVINDLPLRGRLSRILWDQWGVYSAAKQAGNEWLFLPKGFASFVRRPPARLATCVYDDMVSYYASHYPGVVSKLEETYFLRNFRASITHSEVIFTISEFSKNRILENAAKFGLPAPRIAVSGIGFDHISSQSAPKSDAIVVLIGRWPHKRSAQAVDFMKTWQEKTRYAGEVQFVGTLPDGVSLPDFENWALHTRLPESECAALMSSARTLVYFSEYEGFGMPPIEIILAGGCAVFSDIPATREVMDDTGCSFSNDSIESFLHAMNASMQIDENDIRQWQSQLRARHSWKKSADIVVENLSELSG